MWSRYYYFSAQVSTGFASPPAEHPGPRGCPVTTLASIINALVHRARITMVNESGTEMKTVLMVLTLLHFIYSLGSQAMLLVPKSENVPWKEIFYSP